MNMKQIAKLVTAGVLAMAVAPAMSLARTHHPVQAAPISLSATTVTAPKISKAKHTHTALVTKAKPARATLASHKRTALSSRSKHKTLSTKRTKHAALSSHKRSPAAMNTTMARKTTKLTSTKKPM